MDCLKCGRHMEQYEGNVAFLYKGINLTLVGTSYFICQCGHEELPKKVKEIVRTTVKEKMKYPNSEPHLFFYIPELLE